MSDHAVTCLRHSIFSSGPKHTGHALSAAVIRKRFSVQIRSVDLEATRWVRPGLPPGRGQEPEVWPERFADARITLLGPL